MLLLKKSLQKSTPDLSKEKQGDLVAVVGPTATGKTALALDLAEVLNAEVICADSVTAYRRLTIGAAKPSLEDQRRVPHHLLDICEPTHRLTVAEFVREAQSALRAIRSRGKTALVVGGSGLYIDALLYGYSFEDSDFKSDPAALAELETLSLAELQERVDSLYPSSLNESDHANRRRLIQVILRGLPGSSDRLKRDYECVLLGLDRPDDVLKTSISERSANMLEAGFIEEVRHLLALYGPSIPCLQSVGYRQVVDFLSGEGSVDELAEAIDRATWQLVRKQRTWFRRADDIVWIRDAQESMTVLRKNGYNV